ncbi:MAG: nucleotidyltransferase domain-containing protein [Sedimentisphaerales bacterium]
MPNKNENNIFELLEKKLSCNWQAIRYAQGQAENTKEKFCNLLNDSKISGVKLIPEEEASIVVFGSLARGEWTTGSDVDWTLLIDGPADPEHRNIAHIISTRLEKEGLGEPSPAGAFGNMAFSHDIIHQIGGQKDTNRNTTQRILLLLESRSVIDDFVYDRVIRSVLMRYLEDDISFPSTKSNKYKIPRFLLNDIVRYWRTMAVDYAHKRYERAGKGWALRNIKLRMSRKLIFVSGLLTCFSCYLNPSPSIGGVSIGTRDSRAGLVEHLVKYVGMTPLEVLTESLSKYALEDTARQIMDAYNSFLSKLADSDIRNHLEELDISKADTDKIFNELCGISRKFQNGLTSFFFDNKHLAELTRKYGVF